MIVGVTAPSSPAGEPSWSGGELRLEGGRLAPPGTECWAWSAERVAWHYWSRWTTGATRNMRGWFGGGIVSTVAIGQRAKLWSALRWLPDDGDRRTPEQLADLGRDVAQLCRQLGLDGTKGSPGSVAVGACNELGRLPRVPHDQQAWAADAIYGGRNEAWRPGTHGQCTQWDRASAYVAHLAEPLPCALSGRWTESPRITDDGISDALVLIPDHVPVPPLPARAACAEGVRTIYPHGRVRGRWSHEELRAAVERGCRVLTLGPGYVYPRFAPVPTYRAFADRVWQLRRQHPLVKRVGVGLVGRMHAGLEQRRVVPIRLGDDPPDQTALVRFLGAEAVILGRGKGELRTGADVALMRLTSESWAPSVNMPAAVHLLARARLELLAFLEHNRERVIACATDGAILTGIAPPSWHRRDARENQLGAWRVEALARSCQLVGPVHYRMTLPDGTEKLRASGLLRERVDAFMAGRTVKQPGMLGMACGPGAGRVVVRTLNPDAVSVTGGRVRGRPAVCEVMFRGKPATVDQVRDGHGATVVVS